MAKFVSGSLDKLCAKCVGGVTRMKQLPMTRTWICPECFGTEWYTPKEAEDEQWITKEE